MKKFVTKNICNKSWSPLLLQLTFWTEFCSNCGQNFVEICAEFWSQCVIRVGDDQRIIQKHEQKLSSEFFSLYQKFGGYLLKKRNLLPKTYYSIPHWNKCTHCTINKGFLCIWAICLGYYLALRIQQPIPKLWILGFFTNSFSNQIVLDKKRTNKQTWNRTCQTNILIGRESREIQTRSFGIDCLIWWARYIII